MQTEKINPEKILYDWTIRNFDDRDLAELELEILPKYVKEGLLVADIGCGDGRHMVYFSLKGNQAVGINLHFEDKDARKRGKEYGMQLSVIRGTLGLSP